MTADHAGEAGGLVPDQGPSMPGPAADEGTLASAARPWTAGEIRSVIVLAVLSTLAAYAYLVTLTHDLFVLTEVRSFLLDSPPIDLLRFLILPEPDGIGTGRLATHAVFGLTFDVCGVSSDCANAAQSLLLALGAGLIAAHTYQVSRGLWLSAVATGLWIVSSPTLDAALWQSTQFDKLAVIAAIAAGGLWYWLLGRPAVSRAGAVGFVVASVLVLALAFNAKETTFFLPGVLLVLAVLRGLATPDGVRRNLRLALVPLGYAAWYIVLAFVRLDPQYVSHVGSGSLLDNGFTLMAKLLGLGGTFELGDWGPWFDTTQRVAKVLFAAAGITIAALLLLALRGREASTWRARVVAWTPEIYLLAVSAGVMLLTLRTSHPSAYYLMLPFWSLSTLGLLLVRRGARSTRHPALVNALVGGLLVLAMLTASVSHFGDGGAPRRLVSSSDRFMATAAIVRGALAGRAVSHVDWRADGQSDAAWYILRDMTEEAVPGPDLWPFVMQDASQRPTLEPLLEGTAEELRARATAAGVPGRVLLVTGPEYRLELLMDGAEIIYERPASPETSRAHPGARPDPGMTG